MHAAWISVGVRMAIFASAEMRTDEMPMDS